MSDGMLSGYPAEKIIVGCDKCGLHAQYDKLAMSEIGGNRPLTHLLTEIVRRKGCTHKVSVGIYDRCRVVYSNISPRSRALTPSERWAVSQIS